MRTRRKKRTNITIGKERLDAIVGMASDWSKAVYDVTVPNLPILLVDRVDDLDGALAGVEFSEENPIRPLRILFARATLNYEYIDVLDIAEHEILHIVAWCLGQDYHDGSTWFENEAAKHYLPSQAGSLLNNEIHLTLPPSISLSLDKPTGTTQDPQAVKAPSVRTKSRHNGPGKQRKPAKTSPPAWADPNYQAAPVKAPDDQTIKDLEEQLARLKENRKHRQP